MQGADFPAGRQNNTVVMQSSFGMRAIHAADKVKPIQLIIIRGDMDREEIIGYDALYDSMTKCAKGVRWKGSVGYYIHHWTDETEKLCTQIHEGTYRERKPRYFTVTEPKRREIMSIHFRDRVFQRSLNDVGIYPQASRSFIPDNFACQKGKGTEAARDRLREFLRRFYRKYGVDGYALKIDIKGYYPNMDHRVAEQILSRYIDKETNELAMQVLSRLPGEVGYNPGSQIVQIIGITALDKIDHFIKERLQVRYYIRYMDDFVLLHPDREYLQHCLEEIRQMLAGIKMQVSEKKTFIRPIKKPILFLGFQYRLTETGKVLVFADPKKIKHEKRKLRRMKALADKGKLTKYQVDAHFKAYNASVRYGNSHNLIYRLNRWYESLWAESED